MYLLCKNKLKAEQLRTLKVSPLSLLKARYWILCCRCCGNLETGDSDLDRERGGRERERGRERKGRRKGRECVRGDLKQGCWAWSFYLLLFWPETWHSSLHLSFLTCRKSFLILQQQAHPVHLHRHIKRAKQPFPCCEAQFITTEMPCSSTGGNCLCWS